MDVEFEEAVKYAQERKQRKNKHQSILRKNLDRRFEDIFHHNQTDSTCEATDHSLAATDEHQLNPISNLDECQSNAENSCVIIDGAPDDLSQQSLFTDSSDESSPSIKDWSSDDDEVHDHTSISTKSYCLELVNVFRDANICKSHAERFISLIRSILPLPNRFPSTMAELLTLLNIEDLFIRRSVCLGCGIDLGYNEKKCSKCGTFDEKQKADVYDVDLKKIFTSLLKRLSSIIEQYKQKIHQGVDTERTNDIPFGRLYRTLMASYPKENFVSLILHLDGINLTRSTRLKLWLFSGSLVELPPLYRYQRFNMVLMSVWVGYVEPNPTLWLRSITSNLKSMKNQEIIVDDSLRYTLKFYGVTGDCPALRLILNFIGHGGYYCCWYCYIRGEHIDGKRQYNFEEPMIMRDPDSFLDESFLAESKKLNIFGHLGQSIIQPILDVPLPNAIIADYLHVILLGHAKALIVNLYRSLTPSERSQLDFRFKKQRFPHFFHRKLKPIGNFAFVKATEIRNILLYALLPHFKSYLSIDKLSHLALYVCFVRLLHEQPTGGPNTSKLANELFQEFYRNHGEHYEGLGNFVLHLHSHLVDIYDQHGSLSNIGCFAQEDLIGSVSSNHHGTRYYGELITYYYNIDHRLHAKLLEPTQLRNELLDLVSYSSNEHRIFHDQLCQCRQSHDCMKIYKRLVINRRVFHSLLYAKRGESISYMIQYTGEDGDFEFGVIEYFFNLIIDGKFYAVVDQWRLTIPYSRHLVHSKYFYLLKEPLDSFFFVVDKRSIGKKFISTDAIIKHCILLEIDNDVFVTPISCYDEHD